MKRLHDDELRNILAKGRANAKRMHEMPGEQAADMASEILQLRADVKELQQEVRQSAREAYEEGQEALREAQAMERGW